MFRCSGLEAIISREKTMRSLGAILAASLVACGLPAAVRAADPPAAVASGSSTMSNPAAPAACNCPPAHAWRPHRQVKRHVRHVRRRPALAVAAAPLPPYNPLLPLTTDPGYDRAMVLHARSVPVRGTIVADPGFPPTPAVVGVYPYRVQSGAGVYEYDVMANGYVTLSQWDARRIGTAPPMPAPH
jgi:hypothetical protein